MERNGHQTLVGKGLANFNIDKVVILVFLRECRNTPYKCNTVWKLHEHVQKLNSLNGGNEYNFYLCSGQTN